MADRNPKRPGTSSIAPVRTRMLQRRCACGGNASASGQCAECGNKPAQLSFGATGAPLMFSQGQHGRATLPPSVHDVLRSPGQPLDPGARAAMEPRFGHDFSRIRIHTDAHAADSARAVNALAYTVGNDVVFGAGQYRPGSAEGNRLIAHELTHTIQQSGGDSRLQSGRTESGLEGEAEAASHAAAEGGEAKVASGAPVGLSRQPAPWSLDPSGPKPTPSINIGTSFVDFCKQNPDACCKQFPDLCLDPGTTTSGVGPRNQVTPPPQQGPASPSKAAPGLSDLLSFKFSAGGVQFAAALPKSVTAKLPVALSAAKTLTFELSAATSLDFGFSITLDGLPHVKVVAKAGVHYDKDKQTASGSASVEFQATRTVCSASNPEDLKTKIQSAGDKLKTAMDQLASAKPDDRPGKLADIAGAIADMYDAVDKSKSACKQVTAATLNFGAKGPLSSDADPSKRQPGYLGATLTIPF